MKVVKSSHHREKIIFSVSFILCIYEMMDVHCDVFMMSVSQIIMLYNLNLYSTAYQLYLKTGKKDSILLVKE